MVAPVRRIAEERVMKACLVIAAILVLVLVIVLVGGLTCFYFDFVIPSPGAWPAETRAVVHTAGSSSVSAKPPPGGTIG